MFKKTLILLILASRLFSLGVGPGDKEYIIDKEAKADFVFPKEYEESAQKVMGYLDEIFQDYDYSYNHHLTRKPTVILASNHNQITNATATVIPNTIMTWYGGGASGIDYFNSPDWALTLALHETSHIYQMDAKEGISKDLNSILGTNVLPVFAPLVPFWVFTVPNTLLPDFFLEGNAVFNESRYGEGGRMYGGRHRALFLSLLKDNKLNFSRLLNNHDDFPFLEEKYIVGGYFFTYLQSRYGTDRVNSFFIAHSTHWFNPLNITDTCHAVFGKSYHQLIYEFLVSYVPMARRFTHTEGKVVGKSLAYAPFGESEDSILFFQSDLVTEPKVKELKAGDIKVYQGDFLTGTPFKIDGKIYTRSSSIIDKIKTAFSLFDEDRDEDKRFRDKIVQAVDKDDVYYFRGDLFGNSDLYKNGQKIYDKLNSSAFVDGKDVYFFKQEESKRALYKNGVKILEFQGYDSKIVDVYKSEILFTAPTLYGNGLYMLSDGSVERIGLGDDILDGKKLGDELYLVDTVTSTGYVYKIARLKSYKASPVFWSYSFEQGIDNKKFNTVKKVETGKQRSYNALRDLEFNSLYPYFQYLDYGGYTGQLTASFSDPLQQNSLGLSYFEIVENSEDETLESKISGGTIAYNNRRFTTLFGFSYTALGNESVDPGERDYQLNSYINYPFINNTRERFDITLQHYEDQEDESNAPNLGILNYVYDRKYPMAFFSKVFSDNYLYSRENDNIQTKGFKGTLGYSPFPYFYLEGFYKTSKSDEPTIKLTKANLLNIDIANFTMLDIPYKVYSDEISTYRLEGRIPVDKGFYTDWFPVSLQDFVLYSSQENLTFNNYFNESVDVEEKIIGADLNLLFIHRYTVPFKLFYVENSEVEKSKRGKFMFILNTEY